jgi:hypothetical protein
VEINFPNTLTLRQGARLCHVKRERLSEFYRQLGEMRSQAEDRHERLVLHITHSGRVPLL